MWLWLKLHYRSLFATPAARAVTRSDGAQGKKQLWPPMFEPEVFRKQKYCIEHFGVRLLSGIFGKKTPTRTWLCARISPLLFGLRTWSKRQKTRQVFSFAPEKHFFAWGLRFFVSDIISGGLLGHLGLALGANR